MSKINFKITECENVEEGGSPGQRLRIEGYKMLPPSKRITLHQKNMKILNAKVILKHKKGDFEFEVLRINRLRSFGEVRIHTKSIMYPGLYEVTFEYRGTVEFCQPLPRS